VRRKANVVVSRARRKRSIRIVPDRTRVDERRRGGAPRQSEELKKQFVSHTSAALDFVSWCFSTTFADHRDVLATALTRFARRSAPLSRADDF
jgi:hypothetical protein